MEQIKNSKRMKSRRLARSCLYCSAAFETRNPFLRICDLCKETEEWESGNSDIAYHMPTPANDN